MADQKSNAPRRIRLVIGVTLLLAIMATELALSARQQSQTFDEGIHIFAGYRYWKNFDFGANPEHPPLVKLVAAIPLLRLPLRTPSIPDADFKIVEYRTGRDFLYSNDANTLLWRARMAAAVLTICLGLTVFLVAYSMWGAGPAFLALTLLVFEPNFLAHGALVTTDVGATLGLFLGVGSFYFYLKKPSALRLAGGGSCRRHLFKRQAFGNSPFPDAALSCACRVAARCAIPPRRSSLPALRRGRSA